MLCVCTPPPKFFDMSYPRSSRSFDGLAWGTRGQGCEPGGEGQCLDRCDVDHHEYVRRGRRIPDTQKRRPGRRVSEDSKKKKTTRQCRSFGFHRHFRSKRHPKWRGRPRTLGQTEGDKESKMFRKDGESETTGNATGSRDVVRFGMIR